MRASAGSLPTGESRARRNGIADRFEGDAAGRS
jgi:hypothetical protein